MRTAARGWHPAEALDVLLLPAPAFDRAGSPQTLQVGQQHLQVAAGNAVGRHLVPRLRALRVENPACQVTARIRKCAGAECSAGRDMCEVRPHRGTCDGAADGVTLRARGVQEDIATATLHVTRRFGCRTDLIAAPVLVLG